MGKEQLQLGRQYKILIIDDDKDNRRIVSRLLQHEGCLVEQAQNGMEGVQVLSEFKPDLVILDINMEGLNGFQTLKIIRQREEFVSVIFLTSKRDTEDVIRGLESGALDYICKPFNPLELIARVKCQLKFKDAQDELRNANKKLLSLVDIDDLTGLYNMRTIYDRINNEIERGRRYKHGVAVIMMDMDNFKHVNDNHDHLFGSFVLAKTGQLIRETIRSVDFAARYGGDEFLICLSQTEPSGALRFADRLRKKLSEFEYVNGEDKMFLTASFGACIIDSGKSIIDAQTMVRMADAKLYEAKASGKNRVEGEVITEASQIDPRFLRRAA
jgi:two-component system, cell cycle response regulator